MPEDLQVATIKAGRPPLSVTFSGHGPEVTVATASEDTTPDGIMHAHSDVFRVLVFTELTAAGVLFLGDNDPIHCRAQISPGYKIVGGNVEVIRASIYTDFNEQGRGRPYVDRLWWEVETRTNSPSADGSEITFDLWINNDNFKGNFNFLLHVNFIDA